METLVKKFNSSSEKDTIKFVKEFYKLLNKQKINVLLLSGDLGGGKTFITQNLGKLFKVKGHINSPTFNIMKLYNIINKSSHFKYLLHIDAYRLSSYQDLLNLGLEEYLVNEEVLLVIEWPKDLPVYLAEEKIDYYLIDIDIKSKEDRIFNLYENKFKK